MLLKIENLHVKYGNIEALHGINIEVHEGEIISILGANGAGKSTTLLTISGLLAPQKARFLSGRFSAQTESPSDCRRWNCAYSRRSANFWNLVCAGKSEFRCLCLDDQQQLRKNQDWIYELFPILKNDVISLPEP
jgi:branched-chain amino acid transport system ATP-binding protein